MSASSGLHAYGSKLQVSADDVTYTDIGEVVDIDPPAEVVNAAKATHLQSDNAAKENKPGLGETDKLTANINFVKAQFNTLKGYYRTTKYWKVVAPLDTGEATASSLKGQGFISRIKMGKLDPEDQTVIQAMIEITPTGRWTFTSGS